MATGGNQTWVSKVGKQSIQMEGIEMTREKAREAAAVMQAYVDGEEVQYSPKQGKGSSFWTTTDKPLWNWEHYD
jgi:hypothetical protein